MIEAIYWGVVGGVRKLERGFGTVFGESADAVDEVVYLVGVVRG